jgi:hypothetical protein
LLARLQGVGGLGAKACGQCRIIYPIYDKLMVNSWLAEAEEIVDVTLSAAATNYANLDNLPRVD